MSDNILQSRNDRDLCENNQGIIEKRKCQTFVSDKARRQKAKACISDVMISPLPITKLAILDQEIAEK